MSTSPIIAMHDVFKRVQVGTQTKDVIAGVSLEVASGEFLLVLGRSGSGKTTLLGILGALVHQDEGQVRVLGRNLEAMDAAGRRAFIRRDIGLIFQAAGLMPGLSAAENVALALYMLGEHGAEVDRRARDALERVGLGARSQHRAPELSGGEQQRVALARALVKQPKLLLADEPTSQLDDESGTAVVDLLKEASVAGTTVVVATHDQSLIEASHRHVRLEDGRIINS